MSDEPVVREGDCVIYDMSGYWTITMAYLLWADEAPYPPRIEPDKYSTWVKGVCICHNKSRRENDRAWIKYKKTHEPTPYPPPPTSRKQ